MSDSDYLEDSEPGVKVTPLIIALSIAVIALVVAVAFFVGRQTAPNTCSPAVGEGQENTQTQDQPQAKPAEEPKADTSKAVPSITGAKELELLQQLRDMPNPDRTIGPEDAPVKIIEYSDYSCPLCTQAHMTLKPIFQKYADQGKVSFQSRDLAIFAAQYNSDQAAVAARAAGKQGRFAQFQDAIFQAAGSNHPTYSKELLLEIGKIAGVPDMAQFEKDLDDPELAATVKKETDFVFGIGFQGTPVFIVGNAVIQGAQPEDIVEATILQQLAEAGQ